MNILLVEDDATDLKLMSAVLHYGGHKVEEHSTAEQALAAILARSPDLILLDLRLPGLDGLEMARRIKQNPATRHIPIVAVTAAAEQFSRSSALAAGCDAYIVKPVDTRNLAAQLASVSAAKPT